VALPTYFEIKLALNNSVSPLHQMLSADMFWILEMLQDKQRLASQNGKFMFIEIDDMLSPFRIKEAHIS
jgi:hypothetical protein